MKTIYTFFTMKRAVLSFIATVLFSINASAQAPTFTWAKQFGGPGASGNQAWEVTSDASGNVYTTGAFFGTADFDPGVGVFNLTSVGQNDIFISKVDAAGNFVWAKQIGSIYDDMGESIAVDASGNVYITGYFENTADFDPGAGVFNMTAPGTFVPGIFISKLNSAGNFVWAKGIVGGVSGDYGYSIKVNGSGEVFTTGVFNGTIDFDPGAGVFNMTSIGGDDGFVNKLDASGNFVWAKQLGDRGSALALDASGNVITTGFFINTNDFDPGAGVFNLIPFGSVDVFVSKLDASGNFVWAKQIGGTSLDQGESICTDASNNVFISGEFQGTSDFDPGVGTFTVTSNGGYDIFIEKLDASGNFVWAKTIGGTTTDFGYSIGLDAIGNVYSTGVFQNTADFDPGAGVFNMTSSGGAEVFISKLSPLGNFVWAGQIGGSSGEYGNSISIDANRSIYVSGTFQSNPADFNAGIGTYTLTPLNTNGDAYVTKYCQAPDQPSVVNGSLTLCAGSSPVYTITTLSGAISYTWSLPGGWSGASTSNTINPTVGSSGTISVAGINVCGTGLVQTISVTVNSLPTISVNSGSICAGNSFTIIPSGANTYTIQGGSAVVSPTTTSSYTVTGTSTAGCVSASSATSNITVNALPVVSVNSGSICSGNSFTIVPSGANTYTIQGGSAVVSPTTTSSYTVSGTSTAGCVSASSATSNITVNALPVVSVNSGSICSGNSFTIIPSGANTYTIQGGSAVVSPTTTSSYTVTGTSTAGCVSAGPATCNLTVNPLPTISASTSNTLICVGQSATLTASGASTYTFNPGGAGTNITVSPTVTSTYTITGTSAQGCNNSSTFTQSVSTCAGITSNAIVLSSEVETYPNPTSGIINLSLNNADNVTVEIFDITGKKIASTLITKENTQIDLSKEANGMYFLKMISEKGSVSIKIIKQD